MHKKFIALIIASAVAITGVSATQARAADVEDILGGLAAIALLGVAVKHFNDESKKNTVTHNHVYQAPKPKHFPPKVRPDYIRPLPEHVAKYDLPKRCLRTFKAYSPKRPLLGPNCLNKHYKYAKSLPRKCTVGFWNGKKIRRAYEPACLRQKGYRVGRW